MSGRLTILCLSLLLACLGCRRAVHLPSLRETYSATDDNAFGGSVMYRLFCDAFKDQAITRTRYNFADFTDRHPDTADVFFNVSRNFILSRADEDSLLAFVERGNTVFISAGYIDSSFLRRLGLTEEETQTPFRTDSHGDILLPPVVDSVLFSYYYLPLSHSFIGTADCTILGRNDDGPADFVALSRGQGQLFLQANPQTFSNYFLLTDHNTAYAAAVLGLLPTNPQHVFWDDIHVVKNSVGNFSTLSTILQYPALARAFFIGLAMLLLFLIFNSRRRQRVIPVVPEPENTTVGFAEAIAGLYLAQKDNGLIARKMIDRFNYGMREKLFLTGRLQDAGVPDVLSKKSGVDADSTRRLCSLAAVLYISSSVSDSELLQLSGLMEQFSIG